MIPTLWHFGKDKTMEIVKKIIVAKHQRCEEAEDNIFRKLKYFV